MLLCTLCGEFLLKEKSEVEAEADFQSELRPIAVFKTQIIVNSRLYGHCPCQEKSITGLCTKRKVGGVSHLPVIAVHLQSGT